MNLSWLMLIDLFGKQPHLYVNQKERYGTIYTFLISALTVGCCGGFTIYFFLEMFLRKEMTLIQSIELPETPLQTNLKGNHFFISLSLQDPLTYDAFIDSEIYTVEASFKGATRKANGEFEWQEKPLEIVRCSDVEMKAKYKDFFKYKPLDQLYCLKDPDINLDGTFVNDYYSMAMFKIFKCKELNDVKCKSKEEMDYYLNGTFVALMFSDTAIDANDYHFPEKPILSEAYSTVSLDFIKEMHVFLKSAIVTTEENIYFKTLRKESRLSQLDHIKDMQKSKLSQHVNQDQLCEITLKLNNKIDHYKRSYLTITTVIGNVGGIIKAITFVASLLTLFIGNLQYDMFIVKQIFDRSSSSSSSDSNDYNASTSKNTKIALNKSDASSSQYRTQITSTIKNNFLKRKNKGDEYCLRQINQPHKPFQSANANETQKDYCNDPNDRRSASKSQPQLSVAQILYSKVFPSCNKNNKAASQFEQNLYIMKSMLDILNVNKTTVDLIRLKSVLLTNDQNILFDLKYKMENSKAEYSKDKTRFDCLYEDNYSACLSALARNAFLAIKKKGNSKANEKTMVDILDKRAYRTIISNIKMIGAPFS